MPPLTNSVFHLPERLARKAEPRLIAGDEQHFAAIAANLEHSIAYLSTRVEATRKTLGGSGQELLERDLEVHRLTARLRTLRRFGLDLCLGRVVSAEHPEPVYIGRVGLSDGEGRQLLVDWRTPAAEPFFAATHATPMGLASRRRYRWTRGRISDYWDEMFTAKGLEDHAALDDQSAFIASLGSSRSPQMRDVLSTIQADQDAIIRADSRGALVVDGGPGTGKTVVALHRTAYLLYSDPLLGHRRGGVLFVGPHQAYLDYVADVLPGLGEDGVESCTLRDLVPEGSTAVLETDPRVSSLKASARIVRMVDAAVDYYERPPRTDTLVETPWAELWISPQDWAEAFAAPEPGFAHNEARDQAWEGLINILIEQLADAEVAPQLLRSSLLRNEELGRAFAKAWPLLDPAGIVADLWSVPAYLHACAPWLSAEHRDLLHRPEPRTWTVSDLPILDAARQRIGDPKLARRRRQREATLLADREEMERVVDDLIAADDSELRLMSMLRGQDVQNSLRNEAALPPLDSDDLAGPFAHIVVDEAQELTDAEWQMLLGRCPSRSFTIVGDRAQARHGFTESWRERLNRVGIEHVEMASLTINYRTPAEVMAEAEPVIRAVLPDASIPRSIRQGGHAVLHESADRLGPIIAEWLSTYEEGVACVISVDPPGADLMPATSRIRALTPELTKGLEFDLVVLIDPERFGTGIQGAVDQYVAMTRATQQLIILTSTPL